MSATGVRHPRKGASRRIALPWATETHCRCQHLVGRRPMRWAMAATMAVLVELARSNVSQASPDCRRLALLRGALPLRAIHGRYRVSCMRGGDASCDGAEDSSESDQVRGGYGQVEKELQTTQRRPARRWEQHEREEDWEPDHSRLPPSAEAVEVAGGIAEILDGLEAGLATQPASGGSNSTEEGATAAAGPAASACGCDAEKLLQEARRQVEAAHEQVESMEGWIQQDAQHVQTLEAQVAELSEILALRKQELDNMEVKYQTEILALQGQVARLEQARDKNEEQARAWERRLRSILAVADCEGEEVAHGRRRDGDAEKIGLQPNAVACGTASEATVGQKQVPQQGDAAAVTQEQMEQLRQCLSELAVMPQD